MTTTTQQLSLSTRLNLVISSIENYEILQLETDYHKRKFIKSFYNNSLSSVLNDIKSVCFTSTYQNLISYFLGLQRSVNFCVVRSSTILTALILCHVI